MPLLETLLAAGVSGLANWLGTELAAPDPEEVFQKQLSAYKQLQTELDKQRLRMLPSILRESIYSPAGLVGPSARAGFMRQFSQFRQLTPSAQAAMNAIRQSAEEGVRAARAGQLAAQRQAQLAYNRLADTYRGIAGRMGHSAAAIAGVGSRLGQQAAQAGQQAALAGAQAMAQAAARRGAAEQAAQQIRQQDIAQRFQTEVTPFMVRAHGQYLGFDRAPTYQLGDKYWTNPLEPLGSTMGMLAGMGATRFFGDRFGLNINQQIPRGPGDTTDIHSDLSNSSWWD